MTVRALNTDPLRNFKFHVDIMHNLGGLYGTMAHLGFMAASGLAASTEVISYREGGDNTTPRKMPGQTDFPPVSLTRGLVRSKSKTSKGAPTDTSLLWQWYRQIFFVVQGGVPHGMSSSYTGAENPGTIGADFKCEVYIRVFDHPVTKSTAAGVAMGPIRASWKLYNCWPASLAFSDLDAGGNGVLVNNLTLMYEGFDFKTGGDMTGAW